jgi:hypothetical protein
MTANVVKGKTRDGNTVEMMLNQKEMCNQSAINKLLPRSFLYRQGMNFFGGNI